jgi:hypothetical protein
MLVAGLGIGCIMQMAVLAVLLPSGTGPGAQVNLASLQGAPQQVRALPGPLLHDLLEAFAHSYQAVYRWAIPFAVATLVLALLLPEAPLRTTAHVGQGQEADHRFRLAGSAALRLAWSDNGRWPRRQRTAPA